MSVLHFRDRHAAGLVLAEALRPWAEGVGVVVLGMARGGVAVAAPVAQALGAPLDAFVVRRLGVPGIEEVAFGAIAEGRQAPVLDGVHRFIGLPDAVTTPIVARERAELARRVRRYRGDRPLRDVAGRTVIVVDDGLASGASLRAAGIALRRLGPARLIAAVPVASPNGTADVAAHFDAVVALSTPSPFSTVSAAYEDFAPTEDAEVSRLLGGAPPETDVGVEPPPADPEHEVAIPIGDSASGSLAGDYGGPASPRGLVILAHGGGSSRGSYRNRYLAARLRLAGWATLRLDLLLPAERLADGDGSLRFDVRLISGRLLAATRWCIAGGLPGSHRVVLFGASTGAAAAMGVGAALPGNVAGVMARGGRIDLAPCPLARVRAPTLLVIGDRDVATLRANREAAGHLAGPVSLRVVRGAGHTFDESGALGQVGELVAAWLGRRDRIDRLRHWFGGGPHRGLVQR